MKTILYCSFYVDKNSERRDEIFQSVKRNLYAGFDTIVYFVQTTEEGVTLFDLVSREESKSNIRIMPTSRIPEINDYLFESNTENSKEDGLTVIQNLDVSFDQENLHKLKEFFKICGSKTFAALTRWDVTKEGVFLLERADSQDTFCFTGITSNINIPCACGPGWDNRFVWEFNNAGYACVNPSKDIVTEHLHQVKRNNYRDEKSGAVIASTICPEPYLLLQQQTIAECLQKLNM